MKKSILILGLVAAMAACAGWISGTNALAQGGRPDTFPPEAPPMIPATEIEESLLNRIMDAEECFETSENPPELILCLIEVLETFRDCIEADGDG